MISALLTLYTAAALFAPQEPEPRPPQFMGLPLVLVWNDTPRPESETWSGVNWAFCVNSAEDFQSYVDVGAWVEVEIRPALMFDDAEFIITAQLAPLAGAGVWWPLGNCPGNPDEGKVFYLSQWCRLLPFPGSHEYRIWVNGNPPFGRVSEWTPLPQVTVCTGGERNDDGTPYEP